MPAARALFAHDLAAERPVLLEAVVPERRGRYAGSVTFSDIQARLAAILAAEEAPLVEWSTVDLLCEELDRQLQASKEDVPEIVAHFLSDSDIRARDNSYGEAQRDAIRTYLATGDYFDGVAVPWWGCLALMAVVGGLVLWALLSQMSAPGRLPTFVTAARRMSGGGL